MNTQALIDGVLEYKDAAGEVATRIEVHSGPAADLMRWLSSKKAGEADAFFGIPYVETNQIPEGSVRITFSDGHTESHQVLDA